MSWIEGVLSVPTIGIRLITPFSQRAEFMKRMEIFIDSLESKGHKFIINKAKDNIWGYVVTTENGFKFELIPNNIAVIYNYVLTEQKKPGDLPIVKWPQIKSYTDFLREEETFIQSILNEIRDLNEIKYDRIGIVASNNLEDRTTPPGIKDWLKHTFKPWGNQVHEVRGLIAAKLKEEEEITDFCRHSIDYDPKDIEEAGFRLVLDWQRVYNQPLNIDLDKMVQNIKRCITDAIAYFDLLGEGGLSYE